VDLRRRKATQDRVSQVRATDDTVHDPNRPTRDSVTQMNFMGSDNEGAITDQEQYYGQIKQCPDEEEGY